MNAAAFVAIGSWTSSTINKNRIHLKINKNWTIKRSLKHIKVISDAGESPEECTYIKNISRWEKTIGYIETSSNISTLKKTNSIQSEGTILVIQTSNIMIFL